MSLNVLNNSELPEWHADHLKIARNKSIFPHQNFIKRTINYDSKSPPASNRVSSSFRPLQNILYVLGRWPFIQKPLKGDFFTPQVQQYNNRNNNDNKNEFDFGKFGCERVSKGKPKGSHAYKPTMKSIAGLYFLLTTLFLCLVLVLSVLGFCDFFLDWNLLPKSSTWDKEEKRHFESNLVPFVLVWSCLMHSSISSISLMINRNKVVEFMNFWNVALDLLDMNVPKEIRTHLVLNHLLYILFLVVGFVGYKILYLNIVRGGATLVGILTFRPFITSLRSTEDLFKTKLLHHGLKMWNQRFKAFLRTCYLPEFRTDEAKLCQKLLDDYKILLKLARLTDIVFSATLQSYYGSQLLNMCFELYYLARSGTFGDTIMDVVGATIILGQNFYIFFTVSLDAAYVTEEATKGFEILRCHGINQNDSVARKYLVTNLQLIFSQRIGLTGGKFFFIDRPFIVTVLGAVFTYFIIILQVGPSLHKKFEDNPSEN